MHQAAHAPPGPVAGLREAGRVGVMSRSGGMTTEISSSLTAGSKLASPDVASKFAKFTTDAGTSGLMSKGLAARSSLLSVTK